MAMSCGKYDHCYDSIGQCYDCWHFNPQKMIGLTLEQVEKRYRSQFKDYQKKWEVSRDGDYHDTVKCYINSTHLTLSIDLRTNKVVKVR